MALVVHEPLRNRWEVDGEKMERAPARFLGVICLHIISVIRELQYVPVVVQD
jgi:hypothetical protein